jgi:hypothetical protein
VSPSGKIETPDVRINVTRIGIIFGALGAFWLLVVALRTEADDRYVRRVELERIEQKVDRVLDVVCDVAPQHRACK